jgi:hypothetical protein
VVSGHPAIQIAYGDIVPETTLYVSRGPDIFEIAYKFGDSFAEEYQAILNSMNF